MSECSVHSVICRIIYILESGIIYSFRPDLCENILLGTQFKRKGKFFEICGLKLVIEISTL